MKPLFARVLRQRIFSSRAIAAVAVFSSLLFIAPRATPAAEVQKSVLLIYGTRSDMLANIVVDRAIRKELSEKFSVDLDIYSEYFETSPSPKEDFPLLLSWLRRKYAGRTFDVVVPVGLTSLELVRDCGDELFRGAQVVYFGRRSEFESWRSDQPITGILAPQMEDQVRGTFAFIRALQPKLHQLVVVTGKAGLDQDWEKAARHELMPFESQVEVTYLSGLSLESLETQIARLPTDAAVLFLSMNEDGRQAPVADAGPGAGCPGCGRAGLFRQLSLP